MPEIPPDRPASPGAGQAAQPRAASYEAALAWRVPAEREAPEWEGAGMGAYGPPREEYREGAGWLASFLEQQGLSPPAGPASGPCPVPRRPSPDIGWSAR